MTATEPAAPSLSQCVHMLPNVCVCVHRENRKPKQNEQQKSHNNNNNDDTGRAATALAAETVSVVLCALSLLGLLLLRLTFSPWRQPTERSQHVFFDSLFAALLAQRRLRLLSFCEQRRVLMCVCVACMPFNRCRSSGVAAHVACGMCRCRCRCVDVLTACPCLAFHSFIHSLRGREAASSEQSSSSKKYKNKSFCMCLKNIERAREWAERVCVCVCGQCCQW